MNIADEIYNFNSMVNSYKITSLIVSANNLRIFDNLSENSKSLQEISNKIAIPADRIEPLLNGLVFYKIISKNEEGYYLDEYKNVLLKNSKFNQIDI